MFPLSPCSQGKKRLFSLKCLFLWLVLCFSIFELRSIDCKHYDFGNGTCPFGNSCFYKVQILWCLCVFRIWCQVICCHSGKMTISFWNNGSFDRINRHLWVRLGWVGTWAAPKHTELQVLSEPLINLLTIGRAKKFDESFKKSKNATFGIWTCISLTRGNCWGGKHPPPPTLRLLVRVTKEQKKVGAPRER